ncbi:MAG: transposase [Ruminococcus sp.]|nr:transposase [Ruminococcus sp.]
MNKVVKLALISKVKDKDGNDVKYGDVCKILWELQRQTREIKNKAVQFCWEWNGFSSEYNNLFGEYPKDKDYLKNKSEGKPIVLRSFVYDRLKSDYYLNSSNLSTTTSLAFKEFKQYLTDIRKGERSVLNYKNNQPLELHNECIWLESNNGKFITRFSFLNKAGKDFYSIDNFTFEVIVKDNSTKTILERCIDSIYGIRASKLIYNQKKKQWFLNLSYSFEAKEIATLDKDKILGVDLGIALPICASVYGDLDRFTIKGGEIEHFRKSIESRKRSLLQQGKVCGDGRIGHGIHTRNKPAYNIEDKIARFRDTANHKYSRALIDYAVRKGCGTIQMEMLKGITEEKDPFLKNWTYFDLQQKIEYKAKEKGIKVVYIAPKYTSRRCSKCGHIDKDNRLTQANFLCLNCGYKENADYNASQNIAIKDIDKIIIEETKGGES